MAQITRKTITMKKIILTLCLSSLLYSVSVIIPAPVQAQDAQNVNITKRRPDRPSTFSPSPSPTISPAEIKQVQSAKSSFFRSLWEKFLALFQ